MLLSRNYLLRRISTGQAGYPGGSAYDSQVHCKGGIYIAVDRYDLQRTDHFTAADADLVGVTSYA